MEELLGRKTPYSAPAEQAVIGSMLIDPRCVPEVLEKLKADEFYIKRNRDIYETILAMFSYGQTVDPVTVLDQMKVRGVYEEGCTEYVAEVMRVTPTAANVLEYADIVRDRALLRRLGEAADEINGMIYEGAGEADAMLEAAEKIPGVPTGLADLDSKILGLNKSELVLVAARPGMGKTSIALNMALHVAMAEHKAVAIFSLEMSREQLVMRLLSRAALVPLSNLLTGQLTPQQWNSISDAAQQLSATDIRIDDNPRLTVSDMNALCRRVPNLSLVVIDYLQLLQSAGGGRPRSGDSRTQEVSDISRMMKIMAKELNVPVICASQLNRANEARQDKRPMLSDLRESGAIEQDADVVIGLYREGYYNREAENPNLAEAIVLKNRKGQTGAVELNWMPEYTSFTSVERGRDDEY